MFVEKQQPYSSEESDAFSTIQSHVQFLIFLLNGSTGAFLLNTSFIECDDESFQHSNSLIEGMKTKMSDRERGTVPDISLASPVSLATLSTTQQLVKKTNDAKFLTKRVLNSCGISSSALSYLHFTNPPVTPSLTIFTVLISTFYVLILSGIQ
ncbi:unnamed protein product [Protopolystoma xenopodis]|uniref:Uncharacterized protein n=1 Tax=Protopolystoma xenopodis TaxID=117903 RepID=A0A3S5BUX2_9PLAT|nr:unnamed protein product [Protopolystoma xenopodis]